MRTLYWTAVLAVTWKRAATFEFKAGHHICVPPSKYPRNYTPGEVSKTWRRCM